MGFKDMLNKLTGKAKGVAEKSGDKIAGGVDKVTDKLDEKTGGKYHDKLEKIDGLASKLESKEGVDEVAEKVEDAIDKLPGSSDSDE